VFEGNFHATSCAGGRKGPGPTQLSRSRRCFEGRISSRIAAFAPPALSWIRHCRIVRQVYTVIETPTFVAGARALWSEEERGAFCAWIAANPEAGDVIPGSGGCRKVRWTRSGIGKRGGIRVIYFTRLAKGEIWLLVIYAKSVRGSIPASILKAIREAIAHGG